MIRTILLALTLLATSATILPAAAAHHDHPCEDLREATGVATCWPFWHAECVARSTPKTVLRCFEGGEPL